MANYTRDDIIEAAKKAATKVNGPLSFPDFERLSGITRHYIQRVFPEGSWSEVKRLAGLERHPMDKVSLSDDELLREFHRIASELGRIPTWVVFSAYSKITTDSTVSLRFGGRQGTLKHYKQWLEENDPTSLLLDQLHTKSGRKTASRKLQLKTKSAPAKIDRKVKLSDVPPDFSNLVREKKMQDILKRRWNECVNCIGAGAPLAATVMIGGLLEGLLLARVYYESDKEHIFKAFSAPKDSTGKTLQLDKWGLSNYIDVAHELGWISQTAKSISVVLRDYRNYIHPQQELKDKITLDKNDPSILWEVAKSISAQILKRI